MDENCYNCCKEFDKHHLKDGLCRECWSCIDDSYLFNESIYDKKENSLKAMKTNVKRSYSEITDEFLEKMLLSSPFNSVDWVRFKGIQIEDYIKMTKEYRHESDDNHYLYRNVRYSMKSAIKKSLKKKGCKIKGDDYKIAKYLLQN